MERAAAAHGSPIGVRAALSLEGLRAKAVMERAKAEAEFNELSLEAMNLEAVLLAFDSEIIDIDIQIAASKSDASKEEIERLSKEYEEHYLQAMEIMRGRNDDEGMPFDADLLPPSSPLRRYNPGGHGSSPMSGIHIMHTR